MKQLITPTSFQIDDVYTNDQIWYALEISNLGGIRPKLNSKKELDFVVLITSSEENKKSMRNPYADKIEGDILIYTGSGLKGEQGITGFNKRLVEQFDRSIPILGFIKEDINAYKFIGFLLLLRYYPDYQLDSNGSMRKVLVFEFQILKDVSKIVVGDFKNSFDSIYKKVKVNITENDTKIDKQTSFINGDNDIEELKNIELLKSKLMIIDPYEFEHVISRLISHVGFTDVKVTKKSGDDGVDVNAILKNPVSVDLQYAIQVKRWKHSVGRNEVANLRGSMSLNNQGIIIATSHFTESAIREANFNNRTPINLVGLSELYNVIQQTNFKIL